MFIPGTTIYIWYWADSHGWGSQKKLSNKKRNVYDQIGF